jgi:hypothetical protein
MKTFPIIVSTARIARLKLFFGSAVIFASIAAAGQAESLHAQQVPLAQKAEVIRPDARPVVKARSLYPQTIPQTQSANIVRPTSRPVQSNCTQLEQAAHLMPEECGTLTLNDVVKRITAITDADDSK